MVKQIIRLIFILLSFFLILACETGNKAEFELQVKAALDGKPALDARVLLDGNEIGMTDTSGYFSTRNEISTGKQASGCLKRLLETEYLTEGGLLLIILSPVLG